VKNYLFLTISRRALLAYTLNVLRTYNIRPKKRLSQNFVIDPSLIGKILTRIKNCNYRKVLEIGGGIGTLTLLLSNVAEEVVTVEVDKKLVTVLEKEVASKRSNVKVVHGDILKVYKELGSFDAVVSNIPYHISSKVLFILTEMTFREALLTFQKEFADRLLARPDGADYGRLTVMANFYFDIEYLGTYPPTSFYPPPKVYSALVSLKKKTIHIDVPLEFFQDTVRKLFTLKNRTLRTVLKNIIPADKYTSELPSELKKYMKRRVRSLSLGELIEIASILYKHVKGS